VINGYNAYREERAGANGSPRRQLHALLFHCSAREIHLIGHKAEVEDLGRADRERRERTKEVFRRVGSKA
jgi:hypothetical protein